MFVAKAIAYDEARNRLGEFEVPSSASSLAAAERAVLALQTRLDDSWHSIEIVLTREE